MSMTTPTTSRVSEAQRDAFEKWLTGRAWFTIAKMRLDQTVKGGYKDYRVNDRWNAWQAALASQGDVVAVSEVQAVVDEMDKVDQMLDQSETYASNAVEDIVYHYQLKLSAILNRGGK